MKTRQKVDSAIKKIADKVRAHKNKDEELTVLQISQLMQQLKDNSLPIDLVKFLFKKSIKSLPSAVMNKSLLPSDWMALSQCLRNSLEDLVLDKQTIALFTEEELFNIIFAYLVNNRFVAPFHSYDISVDITPPAQFLFDNLPRLIAVFNPNEFIFDHVLSLFLKEVEKDDESKQRYLHDMAIGLAYLLTYNNYDLVRKTQQHSPELLKRFLIFINRTFLINLQLT